jgi:hypothetical protein
VAGFGLCRRSPLPFYNDFNMMAWRQIMQSYRLLLLDKHGRLLESWVIDGNEDREAIEAAEDEVRHCEYVEIWKGGRPVGICARPLQQLSRRQRLFRYWIASSNPPKGAGIGTRARFPVSS